MFLYLIPAFILVKIGKADDKHAKSLSAILIYACGPAMVISAFQSVEYSKNNLKMMGIFFLVSLVVQALIMIIIFLILKKKYDDSKYRILTISSAMGNVGFFGLPLVKALFPNDPIVTCYSSVYVMSMNLLAFTMGVYAITKNKKYMSIKSALLNPTTFAILFSLPLFIFEIKFPTLLFDSVNLLGKMTTPLCMFVLGMRLAKVDIKKLFLRPFVYISCLIKLVVFPLFAYCCIYFIKGLDYAFKGSLLVLSAAPSAAIILSLAELHSTEQELSANVVLLSTILCIITIPLVLLIL